jgi:hypothetical protein
MPYLSAKSVAVSEGGGFVDFVIELDEASINEVRVSYQTAPGTANGATDVQGQVGTLIFAPGETIKTVRAPLLNDAVAEPTEAFWLDLFNAVNATISQSRTSATIFDNDAAPGTPVISVGDVVVDEAAHTASFFVSMNRPSLSTVTVNYATADDTAQAGQDFATAAGVLSFSPGEVAKTVTVNLIDDALAETDEFFRLVLSNPNGATLADAVGAALIGRNDTAFATTPQVLVQSPAVGEGDTYVNFVVQLSAPSVNEVRVNYATAPGTANGATDVQGQVGTLRFAPGETTKVVQALVLNDLVAEQTEGFWFDLSGAVNAVIPQARTAATIFDDDNPASPIFSHGLSNDLYNVTNALDRIVESVNGGIDTVRSTVSYVLPENVENLVLTGASALNGTGNASGNALRGNSANNTFDGMGGVDTAIFSGPAAAYTVAGTTVSRTVSSAAEGNDTLFNVERLQFSDTILASDTAPGGNTYNAYAMINAAFNRAPSTQELSQWTSQLDRLGSTRDLAQAMITYYAPGVPNEALVAYLWSTIVEVPITPEALVSFTGLLTSGAFTQASLLEFVTLISFNTDEIIGIVGQTLPLDPGYFPPPSL